MHEAVGRGEYPGDTELSEEDMALPDDTPVVFRELVTYLVFIEVLWKFCVFALECLLYQALRSADALPHRAGAAPLKTGVRAAQLKRPSSAPLVHPPASDGGSDLRIRQRAYDDQRAGRGSTPQHAVVRPAPKVFDANATCNHCFKPGRVRRDENGRLQPKLSSRLARMSVPTFMGLPLVWHPEAALRAVRR